MSSRRKATNTYGKRRHSLLRAEFDGLEQYLKARVESVDEDTTKGGIEPAQLKALPRTRRYRHATFAGQAKPVEDPEAVDGNQDDSYNSSNLEQENGNIALAQKHHERQYQNESSGPPVRVTGAVAHTTAKKLEAHPQKEKHAKLHTMLNQTKQSNLRSTLANQSNKTSTTPVKLVQKLNPFADQHEVTPVAQQKIDKFAQTTLEIPTISTSAFETEEILSSENIEKYGFDIPSVPVLTPLSKFGARYRELSYEFSSSPLAASTPRRGLSFSAASSRKSAARKRKELSQSSLDSGAAHEPTTSKRQCYKYSSRTIGKKISEIVIEDSEEERLRSSKDERQRRQNPFDDCNMMVDHDAGSHVSIVSTENNVSSSGIEMARYAPGGMNPDDDLGMPLTNARPRINVWRDDNGPIDKPETGDFCTKEKERDLTIIIRRAPLKQTDKNTTVRPKGSLASKFTLPKLDTAKDKLPRSEILLAPEVPKFAIVVPRFTSSGKSSASFNQGKRLASDFPLDSKIPTDRHSSTRERLPKITAVRLHPDKTSRKLFQDLKDELADLPVSIPKAPEIFPRGLSTGLLIRKDKSKKKGKMEHGGIDELQALTRT